MENNFRRGSWWYKYLPGPVTPGTSERGTTKSCDCFVPSGSKDLLTKWNYLSSSRRTSLFGWPWAYVDCTLWLQVKLSFQQCHLEPPTPYHLSFYFVLRPNVDFCCMLNHEFLHRYPILGHRLHDYGARRRKIRNLFAVCRDNGYCSDPWRVFWWMDHWPNGTLCLARVQTFEASFYRDAGCIFSSTRFSRRTVFPIGWWQLIRSAWQVELDHDMHVYGNVHLLTQGGYKGEEERTRALGVNVLYGLAACAFSVPVTYVEVLFISTLSSTHRCFL